MEQLTKLKKLVTSPSVATLWHKSEGHRLAVLMLSLGRMTAVLFSLGFTVATKNIVDCAVTSDRPGVIRYAWLLLAIIAGQLLTAFFLRIGSISTSAKMRRDIRLSTIREVLGKQYSALVDTPSGELTSKILSDANQVASGILDIVPMFLCLATEFFGAGLMLFHLNPGFLLTLVAAGLIGAAMIALYGKRIKLYHKESRKREDQVQAAVQESMQNLRIVKASSLENKRIAIIQDSQAHYVAAELRRGRFSAVAGSGIHMIFRFSWLYAMVWGCFSIAKGTMSYGTLTAMLQLVGQVQSPISELTSLAGKAYAAVSSAERLDELTMLPSDGGRMETDAPDFQGLEVRNVSFRYDRQTVLNHVSFSLQPGEIVALTGDSGCGKSTLFSLLLGLYAPDEGSLLFATSEGSRPAGKAARCFMSYVPQGNALFSGTLRDNISMFREQASEEEIWEAARKACIADFISSLEQGLDTVIGEKGLGLSEGQAQRIAVARALLSNAPILLLDEATSALDENTEKQLLENIAALTDRACIIVTHRRSALRICSRRLHVENGTLTIKWEIEETSNI